MKYDKDIPIQLAFGENIRALRLKRNWSIQTLSKKSGVHHNYLSDLERGKRNVSLTIIYKLAKGFDIDVKEFF